jgi:type II secretory pathway pseudopilin PulG
MSGPPVWIRSYKHFARTLPAIRVIERKGLRAWAYMERGRLIGYAPSLSGLLEVLPHLLPRFKRPAPVVRDKQTLKADERGVTALELLLVVGVLAILLAVSVPLLAGLREDVLIRSELEQLWSEVTRARQYAIAGPDGTPVDPAPAGVLVIVGPAGVSWTGGGSSGTWTPTLISPGLAFWTWQPNGTASAAIDVPIATPRGPARLLVSRPGRVRVTGP